MSLLFSGQLLLGVVVPVNVSCSNRTGQSFMKGYYYWSFETKHLRAKCSVSSVSLFNGISTFVGYLMPKPFSLKNSSSAI